MLDVWVVRLFILSVCLEYSLFQGLDLTPHDLEGHAVCVVKALRMMLPSLVSSPVPVLAAARGRSLRAPCGTRGTITITW